MPSPPAPAKAGRKEKKAPAPAGRPQELTFAPVIHRTIRLATHLRTQAQVLQCLETIKKAYGFTIKADANDYWKDEGGKALLIAFACNDRKELAQISIETAINYNEHNL